MTHRGPFQLLPFCDSVIKQHKGFGSVAICGQIKEGEYPAEGISQGAPTRR